MGRPPIGRQAMSGAERVRRHREKFRYKDPVTKQTAEELRQEVERLRHENVRLRQRVAELEEPARPEPPREAAARERMRVVGEAHERERARWGGRPRQRVVADIRQLLAAKGLPDVVYQRVVDAMLPHVTEQANIEKGISRRTFRKVLADLHTDRNPAAVEAFIAFKKLDAKKKGEKHRWMSVVIDDDKVQTMADFRRKRQEQSERAKAAAKRRHK